MTRECHIVCGYLRTPEGEAALHEAIREAQFRRAHLTVLHSRATSTENSADGTGFVEHELIEPADRPESLAPPEAGFYEEELAWLDRVLSSRGVSHTVKEVPTGHSAGEDIVRVAHEEGADLIVIGIRRRSRIGKLLLGSDAQTILLEASCPVLAVRPK